jgi:hypothetical protein
MAALKPGDIVTVTATGHGAMHTRFRESYISHRRGYPEVTSAASFAAAWRALSDDERAQIRHEEALAAAE